MITNDMKPTALASTFTNQRLARPAALGACLILLSGLMIGCGPGDDANPAASNPPAATEGAPAASPPATTATEAPTESTAAPQSTVPSANPAVGIQGTDVLCSTPSQTAQVTWQDAEPLLTITQKPYQPVLDKASPVAIQENADSSVTYGYLQEPTAYIKTFADGNCMVQTLDAQGNVTTEEYGRAS